MAGGLTNGDWEGVGERPVSYPTGSLFPNPRGGLMGRELLPEGMRHLGRAVTRAPDRGRSTCHR